MSDLRQLLLSILALVAIALAVASALPAREAPRLALTAGHVPRY